MKNLEENKVYKTPFAFFNYERNCLNLSDRLRAMDNNVSLKDVEYFLKDGVLYINGTEIHWDYKLLRGAFCDDPWLIDQMHEKLSEKYEDFHFKKVTRTKRVWFSKKEYKQWRMVPYKGTNGWLQRKKTTKFEYKTNNWSIEQFPS